MEMFGPAILSRSLSKAVPTGKTQKKWQYHPRSDRHSKIACWCMLFDLIRSSPLIRKQIEAGTIGFGVNHEMSDFKENRKKNLDLVICSPGDSSLRSASRTFRDLMSDYHIVLNSLEDGALAVLPEFRERPVGAVYLAMEAKACMTEHSKARPRLFDELNSSHLTIHGAAASGTAIPVADSPTP